MKPKVISVDDPACAEEAAAVLRQGGLIVYPTDTVYGLGALATDDEAVRRLFQVKGRAPDRPLPLLLADTADVTAIAIEVPPMGRRLMERFWPGGLTLVLWKAPRFHSLALAGGDTVGVRVPDHPLLRQVIRRAGGPVTGTSANRSGLPSPRTVAEALDQIAEAVELAIDGSISPIGVVSTVIDITSTPPRIVREGTLGRQEVEEALGTALGTVPE